MVGTRPIVRPALRNSVTRRRSSATVRTMARFVGVRGCTHDALVKHITPEPGKQPSDARQDLGAPLRGDRDDVGRGTRLPAHRLDAACLGEKTRMA